MAYSQLGCIFLGSPQSDTPRKREAKENSQKKEREYESLSEHFRPGYYVAQIACILRCLDGSYSDFYNNVNLEQYLTL